MVILDLAGGIKSIADVSGTYVTWSLTMIGASILAIVSTSYFRPANIKVRCVYFLFVPGWICLLVSIYYGNLIARRLAASFFAKTNDVLLSIGQKVNKELIYQINYFKAGLVLFILWLTIYLLWWILGNWEYKK